MFAFNIKLIKRDFKNPIVDISVFSEYLALKRNRVMDLITKLREDLRFLKEISHISIYLKIFVFI